MARNAVRVRQVPDSGSPSHSSLSSASLSAVICILSHTIRPPSSMKSTPRRPVKCCELVSVLESPSLSFFHPLLPLLLFSPSSPLFSPSSSLRLPPPQPPSSAFRSGASSRGAATMRMLSKGFGPDQWTLGTTPSSSSVCVCLPSVWRHFPPVTVSPVVKMAPSPLPSPCLYCGRRLNEDSD